MKNRVVFPERLMDLMLKILFLGFLLLFIGGGIEYFCGNKTVLIVGVIFISVFLIFEVYEFFYAITGQHIFTCLILLLLPVLFCWMIGYNPFNSYGDLENKNSYEATLRYKDVEFFCIAYISEMEEEFYNTGCKYSLYAIQLPYGKYAHSVSELVKSVEPGAEIETIIGDMGESISLRLIGRTTVKSYETLRETVVSNSGDFCGSIGSDKFHFTDCPYVDNIEQYNLIYFWDEGVADIFGYSWCSKCWERW